MRDSDRRLAESSSGWATPEDLREASQRNKERQEELRQVELDPVTKQGEQRLDRYERELRLRAMRDEFQSATDSHPRPPRNTALLALVMTVASFLLCAFCGGGTYFGLQLLNQKPSASDVVNGFWTAMQARDYQTAHDAYLSPSLTLQLPVDTFTAQAQGVDGLYGPITAVAQVKQEAPSSTSLALTYAVTRTDNHNAKHAYTVVLALQDAHGTWTISDIGTLFSVQGSPPQPGPYSTPTTGH